MLPILVLCIGGKVILGWEEGLQKMCVGERRGLTVPPMEAYGNGLPNDRIPKGASLYYEVELVSINGLKDRAQVVENYKRTHPGATGGSFAVFPARPRPGR